MRVSNLPRSYCHETAMDTYWDGPCLINHHRHLGHHGRDRRCGRLLLSIAIASLVIAYLREAVMATIAVEPQRSLARGEVMIHLGPRPEYLVLLWVSIDSSTSISSS
jgi:hypothetical protein